MTEKSPDAFRTISEVSDVLDVPAHVLRFWESRFTQVRPVKRSGGRRYYRPSDVHLLKGIRDLLYTDGLTIKGVQKVLREKGIRHVAELGTEAAEPPQAPAPAPKPARPARPSATPAAADGQGSLFEETPAPAESDDGAERRPELTAILGELVALRDAMKAQKY